MAQDNLQGAKTKITLNYEMTEDDLVAFNVWTFKRTKAYKSAPSTVILGICIVILLLFLSSDPSIEDTIGYDIAILITACLTIFPQLITLLFTKSSAKLTIKNYHADELVGKYKLEIQDGKMKDAINGRTSEVPISHIRNIENDKKRLYIYVGGATGFIIPFSAFENEAKKQQFLDTINSELQKAQTTQAKPEKPKKDEKNEAKTKKIKIISRIAALIITPAAVYLIIASAPQDGIWSMQNEVLADPSYLEGAEQINATKKKTATELEIHIELIIQKDNAEKMVKNNVLKKCVDSSIKYGDFDYLCSDPIWEKPNPTDTAYPTNNQDALCTSSWIDPSSADDSLGYIDGEDKSTTILCVNPKTGELWYSYHAKTSTGWV